MPLRRNALLPAALLTVCCSLGGCTAEGDEASGASTSASPAASTPGASAGSTPSASDPSGIDARFDLPPEARDSNGGGDPRPPAYWAVWNSCAPDNRAEEAAANGFTLLDDVLADPGIALGDHLLTGCEESVAMLQGRTGTGKATDDPAYALAAQLLAAELNLTVGAESCRAAEETVVGSHIVLSSAKFDGVSGTALDAEAGGALPDLIELLTLYNAGDLCR